MEGARGEPWDVLWKVLKSGGMGKTTQLVVRVRGKRIFSGGRFPDETSAGWVAQSSHGRGFAKKHLEVELEPIPVSIAGFRPSAIRGTTEHRPGVTSQRNCSISTIGYNLYIFHAPPPLQFSHSRPFQTTPRPPTSSLSYRLPGQRRDL